MAKKRHYNEYYAGMEGRKTQEMEDGGMIREDHSAIANMPQNIIMKAYPKPENFLPEDLDDTIMGVDRQMSKDKSKRSEHFMPKKV